MNSNLSSGKGLTKSYHYSLSLFPSLLVNSKDEIRSFVEKFFLYFVRLHRGQNWFRFDGKLKRLQSS